MANKTSAKLRAQKASSSATCSSNPPANNPRVEVTALNSTTGKELCKVSGPEPLSELCGIIARKVGSLMQ
jgi:hypothetical protein